MLIYYDNHWAVKKDVWEIKKYSQVYVEICMTFVCVCVCVCVVCVCVCVCVCLIHVSYDMTEVVYWMSL